MARFLLSQRNTVTLQVLEHITPYYKKRGGMALDLRSFIDGLAKRHNIPWEWTSQNTARLDIEGFPVHVAFQEENEILVVKCGVAIPPTSLVERELFWQELLIANNAFCEAAGAALGYDHQNDIVTFQIAVSVQKMNTEEIEAVISSTAHAAGKWMLRLQPSNRSVAQQDSPCQMDFTGLRV